MNKNKLKASGILLAGSALLASASLFAAPLNVNADSGVCTGTARYYFSNEEVASWISVNAKDVFTLPNISGNGDVEAYHFYYDNNGNVNHIDISEMINYAGTNNGILNNGSNTLSMSASSGTLSFHNSTVFPAISKKDAKFTGEQTVTENNSEQISKWLDLVYETVNTDMSSGAEVNDTSDSSLTHYLHGWWTSGNTDDHAIHANSGLENPVYEAGILRGIKLYIQDHPNASELYDEFKSEVINASVNATSEEFSKIVKYDEESSSENEYYFDVYRTYRAPIINGITPIDMSYWGIFQHYVLGEGFVNPATGYTFSGDYEGFNDESNFITANGKPSDEISKLYIKWVYDTDSYSYNSSSNTITCSSGSCLDDGYTAANIYRKQNNQKSIWTPGVSTWINSFVTADRGYTYDCTSYVPEEQINNTKTGIPSYGYLAMVLAGAAGVYVIARKRSKFIKF